MFWPFKRRPVQTMEQLARFGINRVGMTIEPGMAFVLVARGVAAWA